MKSFKDKDFLDKLIEKSRASGDLRALGMIYEYYYPKILKYMYYRSNRENYEDLTVETFQKVIRNIGSQEGNFEAWLYKIAENVVKDFYKSKKGQNFPQDPMEQLWGAIDAVFDSWEADKSITYRRVEKITDLKGTAVNVVQMVYGNKGDTSGTGVCFTRDPNSGENVFYGDCLINAQ
ncbi:MAG: sigma factor, partial [Lentisphaerota bacterium]